MLEELTGLLYEQNEYGYNYQNPDVELPEELVEELAAEYGIRTDVHRTCVNCQLRQLTKYGENKIKCNFIADCIILFLYSMVALTNDFILLKIIITLFSYDPFFTCIN